MIILRGLRWRAAGADVALRRSESHVIVDVLDGRGPVGVLRSTEVSRAVAWRRRAVRSGNRTNAGAGWRAARDFVEVADRRGDRRSHPFASRTRGPAMRTPGRPQ